MRDTAVFMTPKATGFEPSPTRGEARDAAPAVEPVIGHLEAIR